MAQLTVQLHDFKNLLQPDLCTIAHYDGLNDPIGIQLFENSDSDFEQNISPLEETNEISQELKSQAYEIDDPGDLNLLKTAIRQLIYEIFCSKLESEISNN